MCLQQADSDDRGVVAGRRWCMATRHIQPFYCVTDSFVSVSPIDEESVLEKNGETVDKSCIVS